MRSFFAFLLLVANQPLLALGFANGIKIGEINTDSVTVWVRTTEHPEAQNQAPLWKKEAPNWTAPGRAAMTQFTIQETQGGKSQSSPLTLTSREHDFCLQYRFQNLSPETEYELTVSAFLVGPPDEVTATLKTTFTTPPVAETAASIRFTVSTCQEFETRDDLAKGHKIYRSMLALKPDFFIQTGDTLYYDRKPPLAKTVALARYRWNRMYALPHLREFHQHIPSYWMHDDHDILKNDAWPGQSYGELTWDDGVKIWEEQVPWPPAGQPPYRTFRWGKDLQIWLPEGRYFRSPNKMKDGPGKSILGKPQWEWLENTMKASDATFKLYISATPVVGPDRKNKNDNHANEGFSHEGRRLRALLSKVPGVFVINGDRHWQYHSVSEKTGLQEFGCGPASDAHAQGWNPDDKRPEHRFLRVKGGFLSGEVEGKSLTLTHHDVDGKVTYETTLAADE